MVSKGNYPKISLFQISEILLLHFTQRLLPYGDNLLVKWAFRNSKPVNQWMSFTQHDDTLQG